MFNIISTSDASTLYSDVVVDVVKKYLNSDLHFLSPSIKELCKHFFVSCCSLAWLFHLWQLLDSSAPLYFISA